jgi:uncharacterized membrane protein HdeD (DUF308 family)
MKKGFGWFFIILGVLNLFRSFIMYSQGTDNAGGILIFGITILVLGIWATLSKPKDGV